MKTKLNLPQELVTGIDVMNTLNGGTSEPTLRTKEFPDYQQLTIRIAGVDVENVKIEINDNQLMIYYFIPLISQEKKINLPRVVYNKGIPYFVDVANISADEQDDTLVVRLPFNELANGYHRDITVKK